MSVSSVSPSVIYNDVANTITVTGSGFINGTSHVSISGAVFASGTFALTTTFVDSSHLTAVVPIGQSADIYNLIIDNPASTTNNALTVQNHLVSTHAGMVYDQAAWVNARFPYFTRDANPQPCLTLTAPNPSWIVIYRGLLTLSDNTATSTFDLAARVISSHTPAKLRDLYLWFYLLGYAPSLAVSDQLAALTLMPTTSDGQSLYANPTLNRHTSEVWRLATMGADMAGRLSAQVQAGGAQLDVHTASGYWLDRWGYLFGRSRWGAETDDQYRTRLVIHIERQWTPNAAIQRILKVGFGYGTVNVIDTAPGVFKVQIVGLTGGQTAAQATLDANNVASYYKALGTQYHVEILDTVVTVNFRDNMQLAIPDVFNKFGIVAPATIGAVQNMTLAITDKVSFRLGRKPNDEA